VAKEPPLEQLRSLFDLIRERANYALDLIKDFEEVKSLRWRCLTCGAVRTFTHPVAREIALPCPKCKRRPGRQ